MKNRVYQVTMTRILVLLIPSKLNSIKTIDFTVTISPVNLIYGFVTDDSNELRVLQASHLTPGDREYRAMEVEQVIRSYNTCNT